MFLWCLVSVDHRWLMLQLSANAIGSSSIVHLIALDFFLLFSHEAYLCHSRHLLWFTRASDKDGKGMVEKRFALSGASSVSDFIGDWWSAWEGETFLHHSFPVFVWCSEISFSLFWFTNDTLLHLFVWYDWFKKSENWQNSEFFFYFISFFCAMCSVFVNSLRSTVATWPRCTMAFSTSLFD